MSDDKRTDRDQSHESPSASAARQDPDSPMTDNQASRLRVLSEVAGEPQDDGGAMTAAQADESIRDLQNRAGYGDDPPKPDLPKTDDPEGDEAGNDAQT